MVVVVQTAGDLLNHHPHTHAIVPRRGWDVNGEWVPIPYVDTEAAERLFRHKVLSFLKAEGLLSEERLELLLFWDHHTGFSAHNAVTVAEGVMVKGWSDWLATFSGPHSASNACAGIQSKTR